MALINCPECKQQISDTAPTCPHCGFVQHVQAVISNTPQQPVTIESTSKTWKLITIVAILLFLIGAMVANKDQEFGWSIMGLSVLVGIVSKIGAWWSNR